MQQRTLKVATWGGAYGEAQRTAILDPAAKRLDIKIVRLTAAQNGKGTENADVLETGQSELIAGCADGSLAKLGDIKLSTDAADGSAAADFIEGGASSCGVASFAWSALMLVNQSKFKGRAPQTLAEAFDVKRFPGDRALIRRAENLFEMLVVAGGTAPGDVYTALNDREVVDDVLKRLEELLPNVIWVDSPKAAVELLESGKVVAAMSYSGRAFRKTVAGNIGAIWDGHVFDFSSWAVSAKAGDPELAKEFIALATSPEYLSAQARLWPYGPMRKSAVARVGRHKVLGIDLAAYMPTSEQNLNRGVRLNAKFWSKNSAHLNDRLAALLQGFPGGVRVPPPMQRPEPPQVEENDSAGSADQQRSGTN